MPYVRSNWEGLTGFNGGGKFEAGHVHSLTEVHLQRPGQSGPRGCFLHGASGECANRSRDRLID